MDNVIAPYVDEIASCISQKTTEGQMAMQLKQQIVLDPNLSSADKITQLQAVSDYHSKQIKKLNGRIGRAVKSN